jgi:transglutaminase/protease-like cytokinesis protein 3
MKLFLIAFATCFATIVSAQTDIIYRIADVRAKNLGEMKGSNVATITDSLTSLYNDNVMRARAIYTWITTNIEGDPRGTKTNDLKNIKPEKVIELRKATPLGFATLFQEMCSQANVRCLIVNGYTKFNTDNIGEVADEPNYSWNVVQLGTSPTEWQYVDALKGAGSFDKKMTIFAKKYADSYFFPDKTTFNLEHVPQNKAWFLGEGIADVKAFFQMPLIGIGAYKYKLYKPEPHKGIIQVKINKNYTFKFNVNTPTPVSDITVYTGEGTKQSKPERVNATTDGSLIQFDYMFKKDDSYKFVIMLDGEEAVIYNIEASE